MKKVITKETIQRLVKDVKEINKCPLSDHGIFYKHDEDDMLIGRALIVGQKDTPYFAGNYFFRVQFPEDYPYKPPLIISCTQGERIRFNPNLYTNGKVCLSILNTWHGEQWSSCQTISTVLLALAMLLNSQPLLNEPGITTAHRDFNNYNQILEYKNIEIAIMNRMNLPVRDEFHCFTQIMMEEFDKNKDDVKLRLQNLAETNPAPITVHNHIYAMNCYLKYNDLLNVFMLLCYPRSVAETT
jgi:ubiquitin-conjugating enzyme E2 Z